MYNQRQQRKPQGWEKHDGLLLGIGSGVIIPFIGLALLIIVNEQFAGSSGAFDGFSD